MSKRHLGRLAAGAAFASATLLVAAPGIASASVAPTGNVATWGGHCKKDQWSKDDHGKKDQWIKGDHCVTPRGWVDGGDGGSSGTNPGLAAGGAGALAAAAFGGTFLVRRRRTGTLA
ncbi:hypothetical protein ACWDWO_26940 [Actinopolymorpha singaporensis]